MPISLPSAQYAEEISLIRNSIPKGELRTSLATSSLFSASLCNVSALHTFAFGIQHHVMVFPISENPGGLVRPEITPSTCTALSNADVHYQRFNFLNIKIKASPAKSWLDIFRK